jgi:hypothetical protein
MLRKAMVQKGLPANVVDSAVIAGKCLKFGHNSPLPSPLQCIVLSFDAA